MSNQYRVERDRDVVCVVDCGRLMAAPLARPDAPRRRPRRRGRRRRWSRTCSATAAARSPSTARSVHLALAPRGARAPRVVTSAVRPRAARRSTATTSSPSAASAASSARSCSSSPICSRRPLRSRSSRRCPCSRAATRVAVASAADPDLDAGDSRASRRGRATSTGPRSRSTCSPRGRARCAAAARRGAMSSRRLRRPCRPPASGHICGRSGRLASRRGRARGRAPSRRRRARRRLPTTAPSADSGEVWRGSPRRCPATTSHGAVPSASATASPAPRAAATRARVRSPGVDDRPAQAQPGRAGDEDARELEHSVRGHELDEAARRSRRRIISPPTAPSRTPLKISSAAVTIPNVIPPAKAANVTWMLFVKIVGRERRLLAGGSGRATAAPARSPAGTRPGTSPTRRAGVVRAPRRGAARQAPKSRTAATSSAIGRSATRRQ